MQEDTHTKDESHAVNALKSRPPEGVRGASGVANDRPLEAGDVHPLPKSGTHTDGRPVRRVFLEAHVTRHFPETVHVVEVRAF